LVIAVCASTNQDAAWGGQGRKVEVGVGLGFVVCVFGPIASWAAWDRGGSVDAAPQVLALALLASVKVSEGVGLPLSSTAVIGLETADEGGPLASKGGTGAGVEVETPVAVDAEGGAVAEVVEGAPVTVG
jgi:hypothetical protein